jgi:DeoR family transcriptional regulator of aga operon
MADDSAPTVVRRERLLQEIVDRGFLRVADASAELGVSAVTVRSDLTALEIAGAIVRVHGGAMPRGTGSAGESSFEASLSHEASAKLAIGRRAAAMVSSGQSVLLDVGTTALAVAHALARRTDLSDVLVVTNGLSIALALEPGMPRLTVVVTGGTLRPLQHSLVNPFASAFLESLHGDIAFIGCNGVDPEVGVTNINLPEAEVKRRMMESAARRVLVADASKLGSRRLGNVGPLSDFEALVTAGGPDAGTVERLRAAGLDVIDADAAGAGAAIG